MQQSNPFVAIVDYGMGNLFSVKNVCEAVGLSAIITSQKEEILSAQTVILPGVGAFGDAMANLKKLDLVEVLNDAIQSKKNFIGICLGMQLLMSESEEFGKHAGLGIIKGDVVRFPESSSKIPQIGWNKIRTSYSGAWQNTPLESIENEEYMYFVHSNYVRPSDKSLVVSYTNYAGIEFASSFKQENIFACQFHPERSGPQGILFYQNLAKCLKEFYNVT